uniref:transmembrane protein 144 isoform X1 n=1 Tax=Ciona intestinalis TaxID=7719 RepID=UPI0002B8D452|nr:transmembrane protein 144 isoform X1 [Ciona intestinalis]XP_026696613.1 transmembrane protein 144 isoform X2 [Ciona intestinalis]|eukprot:XP_026696612.1 transmembrane protein 144 isoform X1 [Ciona intestinalis]
MVNLRASTFWCLYVGCGALLTVSADAQHVRFEALQTTTGVVSTAASGNTTAAPPSPTASWPGYVGAVVAIILFGSNFVPVKKFETGDGMFFQWVLCAAIWIAGLVTNCITNFPTFYPLAMLGGFLWATGNICVVPIIKTIGLGLGMLIWGSFNLLSGWASGRFGWFGLHPEVPNKPTMNYIAIAFAMLSAVIWLFVKSEGSQQQIINECEDALLSGEEEDRSSEEEDVVGRSWVDGMSPLRRRIIGCGLSVFSGTLYGLSFTPVIYIKDNYPGASKTDVHYVFAHFCGIFATSTLYFAIYCAFKKNKPEVFPSAILPGLISGGMWAIADIGWFAANQYLSEAVSFPIITTGPGIIASLWGIFVFKEVRGVRNFIIMAVAYCFTITGAVLAGFSKS